MYFLATHSVRTAREHGAPLDTLDDGRPLWISTEAGIAHIHDDPTCNMLSDDPTPFTWNDDPVVEHLKCCGRCMASHPMWPALMTALAPLVSLLTGLDQLRTRELEGGPTASRERSRSLASLQRWVRATTWDAPTGRPGAELPEQLQEWATTTVASALHQLDQIGADLARTWRGKPTPDHGHQWLLLHTIPSIVSGHYLWSRALVTWPIAAQSAQGRWLLVQAPKPAKRPAWMTSLLKSDHAVSLGDVGPRTDPALVRTFTDLYTEQTHDQAGVLTTAAARSAWRTAQAITT